MSKSIVDMVVDVVSYHKFRVQIPVETDNFESSLQYDRDFFDYVLEYLESEDYLDSPDYSEMKEIEILSIDEVTNE